MKIKKIISVFLSVTMVFSVTAYAKTMQFGIDNDTACVDSGTISKHTMDVKPYIVDGRTMVPARIIGETFGADVQWVAAEKKVVIKLGEKNISMVIGQEYAIVDGKKVEMDVPAVIKNGRTMVPLRFVSETLGLDVQYLAPTKQILITDDPAVFEFNGSKISLSDYKALYKLNKLSYAQNGYNLSPEELVSLTSIDLMDFVVYDSEAKKWGFAVDSNINSDIVAESQQLSSAFGDVLDATWVSLLEKVYATNYVINFLSLLYEPDEDMIEEYRNNALKNHMAAKHILVYDKATAEEVLKTLKNSSDKDATFDSLMYQYSEDPGLATYPDGYVFTEGEMVKEFEDATKSLKPGQISGIVETTYGYHIIMRTEISDEYVKNTYTNDMIVTHLNDVADSGEAKFETYTTEQLIEICK